MTSQREPTDFADLWNFGDPAGSEARFRALAEEADDAQLRLEALTQLARTLGLQRRFDEAEAVLAEAERLLDEGMEAGRIWWLLEMGRVLNTSGRREAARPMFEQAWEAARDAGFDALAVDAAHMAAIVEDGERSLAWNERAMEVARRSSSAAARRWLGSLYNNIGWTYHEIGRLEDALQVFKLAESEREGQGEPGPLLIARWCVARALRSLGRFDEALDAQRALAEAHAAAGSRDGFVHEEIGECLLALKRAEEAQPEFALAHELLSADEGFAQSERARLERLRALGGR